MGSLNSLPLYFSVLLVFASGYLGISLHELTHLGVSRLWTDKAVIRFDYLIIPSYVDFQGAELSSTAIRAIGISPLIIWSLPTILFVYLFAVPSMIQHGTDSLGFALLPISGVVLITSPSDLLAAFFPSAWRARYPEGETEYNLNHSSDSVALINEIRRRL